MGTRITDDFGGHRQPEEPFPWDEAALSEPVRPRPSVPPQEDDASAEQPAGVQLWNATDLETSHPVEWLAVRRIPRAAVTVLVGDEGIGKSLLWILLAAAITNGKALPGFGLPAREPGRVVVVITEDDWAVTVRPRLELAGANLEMIAVICEDRDGSGSPVFPRDMPLVYEAAADLVVVDAFADTVPSGLSLKDAQGARAALHPWKEAATRTGAAVLLLTHTNRLDSKSPRDKYGLTAELRKKARMTLYAQEDEDGALVVGPEKTNIAPRGIPAARFTIRPVQVFPATAESDGTVPLLEYAGESDKTASELVVSNWEESHADPDDDRTEAEKWLTDYLMENPGSPAKDVKAAARKVGISERTVKRAAQKLGVIYGSAGFPRVTTWSLPDSDSRASRATGTPYVSEAGPTGPTGHDKGKHGGPTAQLGQSGHAQTYGPAGGVTGPTGVQDNVISIRKSAGEDSKEAEAMRCRTCRKKLTTPAAQAAGVCQRPTCRDHDPTRRTPA